MQFIASVAALFLTVTVHASTPADIYNDLTVLDADLNKTTAKVNAFTGTASQWAAFQVDINQDLTDLKQINSDTLNSPVANRAQGSLITQYLNVRVTPDFTALLQSFVNKKPQLYNAGLKNVMQQNIANLKGNTTEVCNNLVPKVPNATPSVQVPCSKLSTAFASASAAFA